MNTPDPILKPRKQRLFTPMRALAGTIGAYFGAQFFAAIVIGLGLGLYGEVSGRGFESAASDLTNSTFGQFITMGAAQLLMLGIIYVLMRALSVSWADIGLGRSIKGSDVLFAIGAFIGYFVLLAFILQIVGAVVPQINLEQEQQIGFETATGFVPLLLVFISLVVLPPIVEEILIRGFLYTGLRQKIGRVISAVVASFLFAIAHLQLGTGAPPLYVAAIDTFFLSIVLIALRERTGSLWAGMLVHAFKNGLAFLALFVFAVR